VNNTPDIHVVFAGGGTGGHIFPALAVIEAFKAQNIDAACSFLCTNRQFDAELLRRWAVPFKPQPVLPLQRKLRAMPAFLAAWRKSRRQCRQQFREERPDVVVGTGGFGSGPAVRTASAMGIPTALFNPDAVPGKANRYLASYADRIYVQWEESRTHFATGHHIVASGCPIRPGFERLPRNNDAARLGLRHDRSTLLVTGASLGAESINGAMSHLAAELGDLGCWQILHITGVRDGCTLEATYRRHGVDAVVVPFLDDMAAALRCADLVVARAGAVTLAEITATGTPAVLLPYPYHADQHQRHNARILEQRGVAICVSDSGDADTNAELLRTTLLPIMGCRDTLRSMRNDNAPPNGDAAAATARDLLDLVRASARPQELTT
jgi:UDP-N-acetylglucosamine--N-acetylmuramyl-(pentapeptide) pyrophosphoryl-undecaprenol N-acetylglucosamine transferase